MSLSRSMHENHRATDARGKSALPIMIKPESSNIAEIGHAHGELHVRFKNGGGGVYEGVSDATYRDLMRRYADGDSLGGIIAAEIRPKHKYRKI